ncbi:MULTISPECIES: hypothetical protein [Enterobacteriaceae]|uniref:Uncharacterized protein n=1 Tax=Enterobacter cloacae TaxID=550 RepID=A0A1D8REX7_ENTCL|nr:hypothetical protein [Enterobacter kobei]AOW71437.1 hypothetical protein [Enterobacter cloacae]MDA4608825.1 hypothetical protein [Enterobacter kobei]HBX7670729.1 hypothetical protein [Klebsiella pneumoniae]HED1449705.1 hypothetical protein [Enterobacter hormaechei subsp. steigerwaltii]
MNIHFTIFPKRTQKEPYFLRDSTVKLNRIGNNRVKSQFIFKRSFNHIALILGLEQSEIDRVRKIKQRLPDHKLIGIARWSIASLESSQSALCYLFVCEDNVAYLSAPEMVFTNDTISIDSSTRRSVYETAYTLTKPDTKYGYINLRFHSEYKLVTKRRGPSKTKKMSKDELYSAYTSLLAEYEALGKEVVRLKNQYKAE